MYTNTDTQRLGVTCEFGSTLLFLWLKRSRFVVKVHCTTMVLAPLDYLLEFHWRCPITHISRYRFHPWCLPKRHHQRLPCKQPCIAEFDARTSDTLPNNVISTNSSFNLSLALWGSPRYFFLPNSHAYSIPCNIKNNVWCGLRLGYHSRCYWQLLLLRSGATPISGEICCLLLVRLNCVPPHLLRWEWVPSL